MKSFDEIMNEGGVLSWVLIALGAVGFYGLIWLLLALGVMLEL